MSQIKMRPPVGVLKGTGKGGYEFYVDSDTGRAMVDPDSVATLIAAGWTVDLDGETAITEFVANAAALPATGEALKVYVALDTGVMYRWTGSAYLAFTFGAGTDASGNTVLVGAGGEIIDPRAKKAQPRMTRVACGNSIAGIAKWDGGKFNIGNELELSNALAGAPMGLELMTATTRSDIYGCYAYSGQTLPTILADLQVQWIDQINAAGVYPDLVIGYALQENDLGNGVLTIAEMKAALRQWIKLVQMTWPGALIHLVCPRPSLSYNTPTKVANYQELRDYYLSWDDGASIFVSRADVYESPTSPGTPIVGNFVGSISGTTLTVTEVSPGTELEVNNYVVGGAGMTDCYISAINGSKGVGTYTVSVSQTVASRAMFNTPFTDTSVHPTAKGSSWLARPQAATLRRIGKVWKPPYTRTYSPNAAMSGSSAATGTNVSGTVPTSVSLAGSANATFVCSADQPGLTVDMDLLTLGTAGFVDVSTVFLGTQNITTSGVNAELQTFVEVELISGADNLSFFGMESRLLKVDASNEFQYGVRHVSPDGEADFQDGDVLTLVSPILKSTTASAINQVGFYLRPYNKRLGGAVAFKIRGYGIGVITP